VKKALSAVAAACVCGIVAVSANASGSVRAVEAQSGQFPARAYVLTLPRRASLPAGAVSVTENGQPVAHLGVSPAGGAGVHGFGTVLVIDASNSMSGRPIESAMAAARTFAGRRNPGQELALITFNRSENVVLPFTSDSAQIAAALQRTPQLASGTHIYDGVRAAVDLVHNAGIKAATIILLSDGADVGSRASLSEATGALKSARIRLFAIGLRSSAFDPAPLNSLATAGGGSLSVADNPASLARIYDTLGFRLANDYLLQYDSLALPGQNVAVRISVTGFGATAVGYHSPKLAIAIRGPVRQSIADKVLRSWVTTLFIVLLFMYLIFFAFSRALGGPSRSLQSRIGEFVTVTREDERRRREEVRAALQRRQTSLLSQLSVWERFSSDAELAGIRLAPARLALWAVVAGFLLAILATLVFASSLAFLVIVLPPLAVRMYVRRKLRRTRAAFGDQLADNLEVLSSALRAGHSLVGALAVVVDDAAEPSRSEFQRVLADEQLGVPLEDALAVTVARMDNRDLDQVAVVVVLQRDAGANSAEVLDQIVDNIRSRQEIRRLISVLTAQGRMAKWIVSLLPVGLLLFISLINPSYMTPLWHGGVGHAFLALAAVMIIAGAIIIGRIIDIEA
jgi:tight adherence protein B